MKIFFLHFHICCRYFFFRHFSHLLLHHSFIYYTIHHSIRTSLFYLYTTPCFVAVGIDRSRRNFFTCDQSGMLVWPNVRLWWKFSAIGRSLFCAVREIGKVSLSKWQKNIIIIIRLPLFLCLQTLPKSWGCQHLWWGQPRLESIKTVLCDMLHSEFFWVFKFFDKILPLKVTQYGSIIFMYLE